MRQTLALACLALLTALLPADEKPAINTLTEKDSQQGWLLLFDGETTFGWKIDGQAKVEKGQLILGGEKETTAESTTHLNKVELKFHAHYQGKQAPSYVMHPADKQSRPFALGEPEKLRVQAKHAYGGTQSPDSVVRFTVPAGTTLTLHSVKIHPAGGRKDAFTDLFNGKDLDGWNVYQGDAKRQKSKFTVTKEGWLNVKDGAGDLQTQKKYDDFVLQLECISNGKHLNSGIFFRALPGEYQQGYEAQIRNEFKDKPTQKYVVEEFDAKTHKLTGKKEVFSPAVDYGTGAIYRRVPARRQVSKDGEWFTMTVVARGRHLATWVNGVQQVDWTDNRPEAKNARQGYYGAAGCISIQGHDPTTDLSFRNLRIAGLPR
jgi:hypothetical protein